PPSLPTNPGPQRVPPEMSKVRPPLPFPRPLPPPSRPMTAPNRRWSDIVRNAPPRTRPLFGSAGAVERLWPRRMLPPLGGPDRNVRSVHRGRAGEPTLLGRVDTGGFEPPTSALRKQRSSADLRARGGGDRDVPLSPLETPPRREMDRPRAGSTGIVPNRRTGGTTVRGFRRPQRP